MNVDVGGCEAVGHDGLAPSAHVRVRHVDTVIRSARSAGRITAYQPKITQGVDPPA